jgi:phenylpyruvate tautomerase PptA (4-oxalocrotonate tautomerase family)
VRCKKHYLSFFYFNFKEADMPQVTVTLPSQAWSKEQKAELVNQITHAVNGAAEKSGVLAQFGMSDLKPNVNIQIHESAEGGYAIGGKVMG